MAEEGAGKLINTHDGASSSSSSTPEGSEYQVFLNFRGEDTRNNFTDHLYCNLTAAGIRTFRDNEGLRIGEKIGPDLLKAVERSTISIPIFSKGYASSKWCLMELTQMVKCMKTNNGRHTICPVFYGVTPANVKHQTGSFEEAFLKHAEDEVNERTIQEWKDALKEVAELKGWEKDKIADGLEGELIQIIVKELCRKLKKSYVSLPDNLVGMDHHREEMTKLLDISSGSGVRIVGILGMGGLGKTIIAKFMYNQLCDHFQGQCTFVENVGENVERNGCAKFQKQLVSDVFKLPADEIPVDISNAFRDKKVLIVLDDVKDRLQFDEIIRSRDWFGSGSRIIVTSRSQDVSVECEVDFIYTPTEMNFDDSLLLFSKHAFKSPQPREDYQDISRPLVLASKGLPLYLKVIGSMLFDKEKPIWEETLEKLKVIPPNEVQQSLKISYDALDYGKKQIFLDIACHFIGKDKMLPFYMWDACKFFPEAGIDALVSLSLITIEKIPLRDYKVHFFRLPYGHKEENIFRMHDHLRDLGRNIVREENPSDLGKRSRLWSREEAEEVLNNGSGTRKVETLYMENSNHRIISNDLKRLSNLRYLHLDSLKLKGDFKGLVSNLRWFAAPLKKSIMPVNNFCASKLVILDLSGSEISNGWESWIQIKDAATNLKVLNLSDCRKLTKLPECLRSMKLLVKLDLSGTGIRELSEQGIGNLTNLTNLLLRFSKIKRLPDAMGKLEKLEVLDCGACSSLEEVPEGIWRLSSLRLLDLNGTELTGALPKDISGMSRLETLDLGSCVKLRLPTQGLKLPISLTKLVLPFTKTALDSDSLRSLVNLRGLVFDGNAGCCCEPAAGVGDHHDNSNNNNDGTPLLPITIDMPSNLEYLGLRGFRDHTKIKSCRLLPAMKFDSSSRLDTLQILGFEDALLSGSIDLSKCQMLRELRIRRCNKMREIAGFGNSLGSSWVSIDITLCDSLEVLPNFSTLKGLKSLDIRRCPKLREIKGLEEVLTSLEKLAISYCDSLEVLPNFSTLKGLKTLEIMRCPKLREIKGLEEVLTSLEALTIWSCPLLKEEELHPDVLNSKTLRIKFEPNPGLVERMLDRMLDWMLVWMLDRVDRVGS